MIWINTQTTDPKNSEDWFSVATDEARFQYIKERLEEAQATIMEHEEKLNTLKENRNMLYSLWMNHKHDADGVVVLPGGFFKFPD